MISHRTPSKPPRFVNMTALSAHDIRYAELNNSNLDDGHHTQPHESQRGVQSFADLPPRVPTSGMRLFKRRWYLGTDEMLIPAALGGCMDLISVIFGCLVLALVYSSDSISTVCADHYLPIQGFAITCFVVWVLFLVVNITIIASSCRAKLFSRSRLITFILYTRFMLLIITLAVSIFLTLILVAISKPSADSCFSQYDIIPDKSTRAHIRLLYRFFVASCCLMWFSTLTSILFAVCGGCLARNPSRQTSYERWQLVLRRLFCCYQDDNVSLVYDNLAEMFSYYFSVDGNKDALVSPSDIAIGLILVQAAQKQSIRHGHQYMIADKADRWEEQYYLHIHGASSVQPHEEGHVEEHGHGAGDDDTVAPLPIPHRRSDDSDDTGDHVIDLAPEPPLHKPGSASSTGSAGRRRTSFHQVSIDTSYPTIQCSDGSGSCEGSHLVPVPSPRHSGGHSAGSETLKPLRAAPSSVEMDTSLTPRSHTSRGSARTAGSTQQRGSMVRGVSFGSIDDGTNDDESHRHVFEGGQDIRDNATHHTDIYSTPISLEDPSIRQLVSANKRQQQQHVRPGAASQRGKGDARQSKEVTQSRQTIYNNNMAVPPGEIDMAPSTSTASELVPARAGPKTASNSNVVSPPHAASSAIPPPGSDAEAALAPAEHPSPDPPVLYVSRADLLQQGHDQGLVDDVLRGVQPRLHEEDWKRITLIKYYSRFAHGAYGWPLYMWDNLWKTLLCCTPFSFSCGRPDSKCSCGDNLYDAGVLENSGCCNAYCCNHTASTFRLHTGVEAVDILQANLESQYGTVTYVVSIDHKTRKLVIAIRGTMSVADTITDLDAQMVYLPFAPKFYAHRGMLICSEWLMRQLNGDSGWNIHEWIERNPDYGIVVCGHSLGAGVTTILTVMLSQRYRDVLGIAYAPPPCLDPRLSALMRNRIISVTYKSDLVSRLSLSSLFRLRTQMMNVFKICIENKFDIFSYSHDGQYHKLFKPELVPHYHLGEGFQDGSPVDISASAAPLPTRTTSITTTTTQGETFTSPTKKRSGATYLKGHQDTDLADQLMSDTDDELGTTIADRRSGGRSNDQHPPLLSASSASHGRYNTLGPATGTAPATRELTQDILPMPMSLATATNAGQLTAIQQAQSHIGKASGHPTVPLGGLALINGDGTHTQAGSMSNPLPAAVAGRAYHFLTKRSVFSMFHYDDIENTRQRRWYRRHWCFFVCYLLMSLVKTLVKTCFCQCCSHRPKYNQDGVDIMSGEYLVFPSHPSMYDEILVTSTMFSDHMPIKTLFTDDKLTIPDPDLQL